MPRMSRLHSFSLLRKERGDMLYGNDQFSNLTDSACSAQSSGSAFFAKVGRRALLPAFLV